jgi:hypothetical protein
LPFRTLRKDQSDAYFAEGMIDDIVRALGGTSSMAADHMREILEAGGCDGFVLWPTGAPTMFDEIGPMVVPELQRRGLFRTEYSGRTLRENLRLQVVGGWRFAHPPYTGPAGRMGEALSAT